MKKVIIIYLILLCASPLCAQNNSDIQSYIQQYKQIALEQERKYGVPAPITLAQGIVESAAGKSNLTLKSNNHFGIKKGKGWNGPTVYAWDTEPSYFRVYNSAAESYEDHSLFLRKNDRYKFLFDKSIYDYRGWAYGLLDAHYAGSPTYAQALVGYIEIYKLYEINGGIKLPPGKTITIVKTITKEELVVREDLKVEENEESEEQKNIESIFDKIQYVVEINGIRCTTLYPGETLSSVAMKYDISIKDLLLFNEITSEDDIHEGDIVFLKKKKKKYEGARDFYRVKKEDTLYDISQQFGIRLASLTKMNKKIIFSDLEEGEKIRLK